MYRGWISIQYVSTIHYTANNLLHLNAKRATVFGKFICFFEINL